MINKGWNVETVNGIYGPSKKMKYSHWKITDDSCVTIPQLNGIYSSPKFMDNFYPLWKPIENENCAIFNNPFELAILQSFIQNDDFVENLVDEISTQVNFTRKCMDLYEFYQSTDLANMDTPYLMYFYKFLTEICLPWMKNITQLELTNISASCSLYTAGDYLLVHDDLLSDRRIAFVYYISPWKKNWTNDMGGELEMFETVDDNKPVFPVIRKINPANNQFVFFPVCDKSFHQVAEVLNFDYPRITINGWFHGPRKDNTQTSPTKNNDLVVQKFIVPNKSSVDVEQYINSFYLNNSFKETIQQKIEDDSEASLEEFLVEEYYNNISEELKNPQINRNWVSKQRAEIYNYEYLDFNSISDKSMLHMFLKFFTSENMFKLLFEYTELDLHGDKAEKPKCTFEMQRWKGGSYTVIIDDMAKEQSTLDLVLYFNAYDKVGVITYLTLEDNQNKEDDPILLTIYPKKNTLNMVYRSEGTTKFTKYVSKSINMNNNEYSYIFVCSYKE